MTDTPLNPLDWTAEPFLTLYIFLLGLAVAVILLRRSAICTTVMLADGGPLGPLELALLAGGPARAADTALVGLLVAGVATLPPPKESGLAFEPGAAPWPPDLAALRGMVAARMSRSAFHQAIRPELARLQDALAGRGLTPTPAAVAGLRSTTLLVLAVPLVIGVAKICVGAGRGRPVGLLVLLVIFTAMLAVVLAKAAPRRTQAGEAALAEQQDRHARAARAPLEAELPLAFALAGAGVLAGTKLAPLAAQIRSDGSSSGGGDGGGGDGGGGGGCGGCGA